MDSSRSRFIQQLSDSNELVRKVTRKKKKKKIDRASKIIE